MNLPEVEKLFPARTRAAVAWFWVRYWGWFFLFLPWMLLRQVGVITLQCLGAAFTWNRDFKFLNGLLTIRFQNNLRSLAVIGIFGERFTSVQYGDVLIDPGPVFAAPHLERRLGGACVNVIVATHAHEEHIGNACAASRITGAPIYGTDTTLAALRQPERLSLPRRFFIGQPLPATSVDLRPLPARLTTAAVNLCRIESPGHCDGHASLFDEDRGVLFAGDSFLHTVFTSPNREVRAEEWLRTLDGYLARRIVTMVGAHGYLYTCDAAIPARAFVVARQDPLQMIRDKRRFLSWACDVVAEGERRGMSYSLIEACLFPWNHSWSWRNWFGDESGRLFSAGEFSRTYFVRSLSKTPENVPPRFGLFATLVRRSRGQRGAT